MKFLIAVLLSTASVSPAYAKPTDGILFGCESSTTDDTGAKTVRFSVDGIIPANGTSRLAIHYKSPIGEAAFINQSEFNFRTAQADDLNRRYGVNRNVINDSEASVSVDFGQRIVSLKIPLTVKVDGIDQKREIYLSSVPGSLLYSRNDEFGKTAKELKVVFTGVDQKSLVGQLPDVLLSCTFNDNFK